MKTAIYIEDGVVQLVLTPENNFERNALGSFEENKLEARIFSGEFYDCRGGWTRQSDYFPSHLMATSDQKRSLILRYAAPTPVSDDDV